MDRFKAMQLYCRIIETGRLSAAADQLNLSRGAVSKQLAKLEAHLGGRLLNRTTRRLTPTEAGVAFYERASAILQDLAEAECAVTGLSQEPRGVLKINAPMSFGSKYMGKLLADYQQRYPQVFVDIDLHDRQIDLVEEGYDVAIRIAELRDSSLIARRLAPSRLVLCASRDYLEKHGEPDTPEALKEHQCLLYSYLDSAKYWTLYNKAGDKKQILITGGLRANNGDLLCDAMVNGLGIALTPTFIAGDAIRAGKARIILPDWQPKSPPISLLYPSSKHLSAKVRAFVDMALAHFNTASDGRPAWDEGLN